jgi:hypothetical protein
MGSIIENMPVGSSRNKIEYLAEKLEVLESGLNSGGSTSESNASTMMLVGASMPFRMFKEHLIDGLNKFSGFVYREFTGDLFVGDEDYFHFNADSTRSVLVLAPMVDKITRANTNNLENYPENAIPTVAFGIQLSLEFTATFPEGYAPTDDEVRIDVDDCYFYLPYQWDSATRTLTVERAVGGVLERYDDELVDVSAMSINDAMIAHGSPTLQVSVDGLDLENADSVKAEGVIHIVNVSYREVESELSAPMPPIS